MLKAESRLCGVKLGGILRNQRDPLDSNPSEDLGLGQARSLCQLDCFHVFTPLDCF